MPPRRRRTPWPPAFGPLATRIALGPGESSSSVSVMEGAAPVFRAADISSGVALMGQGGQQPAPGNRPFPLDLSVAEPWKRAPFKKPLRIVNAEGPAPSHCKR